MKLPSNRRLKLAGGDRSKGSGVLCAGRQGLTFTDTARRGRVARSLSAIRYAAAAGVDDPILTPRLPTIDRRLRSTLGTASRAADSHEAFRRRIDLEQRYRREMAWGGPHVRFGVGHSIRDIPGVRQLSTEHTLGAGGLDEGPPLDGRQNVTSDSGRRSRRPRRRVRSVFSCPRVDRRDVLVRRGFGGQPPNKRLKLPARVGY